MVLSSHSPTSCPQTAELAASKFSAFACIRRADFMTLSYDSLIAQLLDTWYFRHVVRTGRMVIRSAVLQ